MKDAACARGGALWATGVARGNSTFRRTGGSVPRSISYSTGGSIASFTGGSIASSTTSSTGGSAGGGGSARLSVTATPSSRRVTRATTLRVPS
ncbi:MAG: hypothetical protein IPQ07_20300 [Myxococcales bacterium]|nr:hypothetical protein [Myxococcales bacterium]